MKSRAHLAQNPADIFFLLNGNRKKTSKNVDALRRHNNNNNNNLTCKAPVCAKKTSVALYVYGRQSNCPYNWA